MRAGWEVTTLRETDTLLYGSAREDLQQHTTQQLGLCGCDSSGVVWFGERGVLGVVSQNQTRDIHRQTMKAGLDKVLSMLTSSIRFMNVKRRGVGVTRSSGVQVSRHAHAFSSFNRITNSGNLKEAHHKPSKQVKQAGKKPNKQGQLPC